MPVQFDSPDIVLCERIASHLITTKDANLEEAFSQASTKPMSALFAELAQAYYRASHVKKMPEDRRLSLIELGMSIEKNPRFGLLSTKAQRAYLLALNRLKHGNNPLRALLTMCRILIRNIILWVNSLPETRRKPILDNLDRAHLYIKDLQEGKKTFDHKELQELRQNLDKAREKITKLCHTYPLISAPQDLFNLLSELETRVADIGTIVGTPPLTPPITGEIEEPSLEPAQQISKSEKVADAYKKLVDADRSIKSHNLFLVQERLKELVTTKKKLLTGKQLLEETPPLLMHFLQMSRMLKLRFAREAVEKAKKDNTPPLRLLACVLINHCMNAFHRKPEEVQDAVKQFFLDPFDIKVGKAPQKPRGFLAEVLRTLR